MSNLLREENTNGLTTNTSNPNILIVDDEPLIREILCEILSTEEYTTEQACDGVEALEKFKQQPSSFDLLIIDLKMPRMDGMALLAHIRKISLTHPVIVLTGHGSLENAYSLLQEYRIFDFFNKPLNSSDRLLFSVKNALEKAQLISKLMKLTKKLKLSNQKLTELSSYDSLTGLYNRRMFVEYTSHAIALVKRNNKSLGILYFDLDDFKKVNDTYGHSIGDHLLIQVSDRVKSIVRESDVFGRIGGDEFALLIEGDIDSIELINISKKILNAFSKPMYLNKQPIYITSSIGIAVLIDKKDTAEKLIQKADTAMYNAKKSGRNCYMFYSDIMNKIACAQLEMESGIRNALTNNEFSLYYQPKIDFKTGRISGAEALIRWIHPEKGIISPGEFIPIAEKSDLIIDIGKWTRETVLQQLVVWKNNNFPLIKISVNVSGKEFVKREVLQHLLDMFMKYDISPSWLELEITEDTLIKSVEEGNTDYRVIQGMDVGLAIDDFGTGYCSLGYLKEYPFETLKIDKSFIDNVIHNERDASIVRTIIAMAHNLNMSVVAEGVENEEQRNFLVDNNCDLLQGFFYSKPQPIDQFENFIKSFNEI
ncbi:EAL domain-containing protein [Spartinivicinus ruber]|uniref:EAL domain-containing protein n=1 Tax=Spartinivicinus ruber TaxID=2683272 RepID=UPI0013D62161|nr:EAL domain-containing protein [Spartinivicinus ruber]